MESSKSPNCEGTGSGPSSSCQGQELNNPGEEIDVGFLVEGVGNKTLQKFGDLGTYLYQLFDKNKVKLVPKDALVRTERQQFEDEIKSLKEKLAQRDCYLKTANRKIEDMKKTTEDLEKMRTNYELGKETGSQEEIHRLQGELKEFAERAEILQRAKTNQDILFEDLKRQWIAKSETDNAKLAKAEENCRNLETLLGQANLRNQELTSKLVAGEKWRSHGQTEIIALKDEKERLFQDVFRFKAFIRELMKSTRFPEKINDDDLLNTGVLTKLTAHISSKSETEIEGILDDGGFNGGIIKHTPNDTTSPSMTSNSSLGSFFRVETLKSSSMPNNYDPVSKQGTPVAPPMISSESSVSVGLPMPSEDSCMENETPPNCSATTPESTRPLSPDIIVIDTKIKRPSVIKLLATAVKPASVSMDVSTGDEMLGIENSQFNGQQPPFPKSSEFHDGNITNTSSVSQPPQVKAQIPFEDNAQFDLDRTGVLPGKRGRRCQVPEREPRSGSKGVPDQTNEKPTDEQRKTRNESAPEAWCSLRHRRPRGRSGFLPTSFAVQGTSHASSRPAAVAKPFDNIVIEIHEEKCPSDGQAAAATPMENETPPVHLHPSSIPTSGLPSQNLVLHKVPIYGCRACPEVFDSFENLKAHIINNHKNDSVPGIRCGLCKTKTQTMFVFSNTLITHCFREHRWAFE